MATGDKLVNLDVLKNTVQKEVVDLKSAVESLEESGAVIITKSVEVTAGTGLNNITLFRNLQMSTLIGKIIAYRFRTDGADFNNLSALIFNGAGKSLRSGGASKNIWYYPVVSSDFASSTYFGPVISGNNITASGTIYIDIIYDYENTLAKKLSDINNDIDDIDGRLSTAEQGIIDVNDKADNNYVYIKGVERLGAISDTKTKTVTAGTGLNDTGLFRKVNISDYVGKTIAVRFRSNNGADFNNGSATLFNGGGKPIGSYFNINEWKFVSVSSDFASSTYFGPVISGSNIKTGGTLLIDIIYDYDDTIFIQLYNDENHYNDTLDQITAPSNDKTSAVTAGTNLVDNNLYHVSLTPYIGKKVRFRFESEDVILSRNQIRFINGSGKFLGGSYGLGVWYVEEITSEFASSSYFGPYIAGGYITHGGTLITKFCIDYDGSMPYLNDELDKINTGSGTLSGKYLWTIWDSLGHNTWQSYFKNYTGCEWESTLNTKSDKPISMGGTSSLPEEDDGSQARAINLVSYKGIYPIDVVIFENINDYKLQEHVGSKTDKPFMRSQKIAIETGQTSREAAIQYANENLSSILSGIASANRKKGTILSFNYTSGSAICGSKIVFNNTPLSDGNVTINWGNKAFSIPVTTSTTKQDMVNAFLQYTFGIGVTDIDSGNGSITITYYTTTSTRATFDGGNTGVTATVTDAVGQGSYFLYYTEDTPTNWTDTTKWSTYVTAYSVYKGLFSYLITNLPTTKFYICTPWAASVNFSADTYKNDDGSWSIDKFSLGSRQNLYNIQMECAEMFGISILNLVKESGMSIINIETYFNSNDVHPKAVGYQQYAKTMANLICKVY